MKFLHRIWALTGTRASALMEDYRLQLDRLLSKMLYFVMFLVKNKKNTVL